MTPKQEAALRQAREALHLNNDEWKSLADSGDAGFWRAEDQDHYKKTNAAITAIDEALAEQPAQPYPDNFIDALKYDVARRDSEAQQQEPVAALESVLCDPSGKCCISGSDADRAIVDAALAALVEDDFKNRLAQAIEQMPFGDTAASFAVFVRNFK